MATETGTQQRQPLDTSTSLGGEASADETTLTDSGRRQAVLLGERLQSTLGVFVQLAPEVVGFLHLSELTDEPVETPDQLVDEGELVTVKVADIDLRPAIISSPNPTGSNYVSRLTA
ncbi:S1 RNA-binding domain-containing protein [Streptomyces sp. NPDC093544]|uniref:S1 RNA-binding domain-containing protein n=1 Tax=Streptomyces sp. NPDC093544 TaxID=3155200 RepID=UPI00341CD62E